MTRKKSLLERRIAESLEDNPEMKPLYDAGVKCIYSQLSQGEIVSMGPYQVRGQMEDPYKAFNDAIEIIQGTARRNGVDLVIKPVGCEERFERDSDLEEDILTLHFKIKKV